jgi:hypothetical protein
MYPCPGITNFPGEVFLGLAADALDWCEASRADPLPLKGLRERFLPECTFRGRQNTMLQYAVLAAAALQGGTDPDLLEEVAWWQTDDFWQYALFAPSPASAPPPAGRACRYARHTRTWPSAPATQRHNDQFGTLCEQSSDGGAADHNGGDVRALRILGLITFRGWRTGPEVRGRLGAWAAVRSSRCRKPVLDGRRVGVDVAEATRRTGRRGGA